MGASSSATKILPVGISSSLGSAARLGVVTQVHGHEHTKDRSSWLRFAFNDAAVIAHDLGDQRQAKSRPGRLGGHERIEQVRQQIVGNARTVVLDAELERQRYARLAARQRQAHTRTEGGRERDLAIARALPARFRGILSQVDEHLDELIAISEYGLQRRVVFLDEFDMAREARMSQP